MASAIGAAHAGPTGSTGCGSGCARTTDIWHPDGLWHYYTFATSDPSLYNNFYVSENCLGGCPPENQVAGNVPQYRLYSAAYVRYCRYSEENYVSVQGWIESQGAFYAASSWTSSLQFRTSHSC